MWCHLWSSTLILILLNILEFQKVNLTLGKWACEKPSCPFLKPSKILVLRVWSLSLPQKINIMQIDRFISSLYKPFYPVLPLLVQDFLTLQFDPVSSMWANSSVLVTPINLVILPITLPLPCWVLAALVWTISNFKIQLHWLVCLRKNSIHNPPFNTGLESMTLPPSSVLVVICILSQPRSRH